MTRNLRRKWKYAVKRTGPAARAALMAGMFLTAALTGPAAPHAGAAEDGWSPTRSMTITAPSNPGGGWDATARFLQLAITNNELSPKPVEVVNRGGGGGLIGLTELITREKGDPHRMLVVGFGMTSAVLMHGSRYSLSSSTPLARLTSEYEAIAVPAGSPFKTLDDLIQAFRADPRKISWGGGSAGGADQIFLALFAEKVGVDPKLANYVAFTGGGEAAAALMGSQVSAAISGYGEWRGLMDAGRIRLLAISAPDRRADRGLPTLTELGVDLTFSNWRGIVAPPDLKPAQKAWLLKLIDDAHATSIWQDILKKNQWQDDFLSGDAFASFIREDSAQTQRILGNLGIGGGEHPNAAVDAQFFPNMIGAGLLISICAMAVNSYRRKKMAPTDAEAPAADAQNPAPQWNLFAQSAGLLLLYILASHMIGFIYATPVFIVLMSRIAGSRAWLRDGVVAVLLTAAIVLVFEQLLHVAVQ